MSSIEDRLKALGIEIPQASAPVANYVPFSRVDNLVHISGQLSIDADGDGIKGIVGEDVDVEAAQRGARLCGIKLIAQFREACGGDLDRVEQVVKLNAFVQVARGFTAIPQVANGCSDLMVEIFGDRGRHARSAVGVYALPLGYAVEVDAVIRLRS
jgi:enamine deaminase RidA (YjgF/YER057c/UK114 family)